MSTSRNPCSVALASAPVDGGLRMQVCRVCETPQYPPRELCRSCLADALEWKPVDGMATVLATTTLHHSHEDFFRAHLPWHVAWLELDGGPVVLAHIGVPRARRAQRLRVANALDAEGNWCLVAFESAPGEAAGALDASLRQLGFNP